MGFHGLSAFAKLVYPSQFKAADRLIVAFEQVLAARQNVIRDRTLDPI